jgi:hypothetical protein
MVIIAWCCCASKIYMRQVIKNFLWIAGLMFSLQVSWSYSFLGPLGNGGDGWQTAQDGFNPLNDAPVLNPYGIFDQLLVGPKNIGEEYRRNTPVMYYVCDDNFIGYFGSNGTNAIAGAFAVMNSLTNVDNYSGGLTEFPLQSQGINFQAQALGLVDLKSVTLPLLMEQLGVGDAIRYTWVLHARAHFGTVACPVGEEYFVTERNFDISPSPLTQIQYSPYVNNSLYTYSIYEDCGGNGFAAPIDGASIPLPVDPLNFNPPVASGIGMGSLSFGGFYTGLTRDDVAGLRYLLQAANVNTESPAAGSQLQTTVVGQQTLLTTFDISALLSPSNSSNTLVTLFPGLVIASSTSYLTNINGVIVQNFANTFANVITNSFSPTSTFTIATTTVGSPIGAPFGSPAITNPPTFQTFVTNVPSGDFFVLPAADCGLDIVQLVQAITNTTTTLIGSNTNGSSTNLVTTFISHQFVVQPVTCPLAAAPAGKYEGIENIKFVGLSNDQYDTLLGQFITPITNNYTMSFYSNGVVTIQNVRRVVTVPDFRFTASDLVNVGVTSAEFGRTLPAFNVANVLPTLAGPGTIDPGSVFTFNKSGPYYFNFQTGNLNQGNAVSDFLFGSFDGTTNAPVIYPNGTSIANVESEVFIQIFPSALPAATVGSAYSASFSATGGTTPYTWSLAPSSPVLPGGLTLSPAGVLSGTPTQNGVFDFIVQLNDSASHIVQENYFITIH